MTYLKLEDRTVLKFDLAKRHFEVTEPDMLPFALRDNITDTTRISATDVDRYIDAVDRNRDMLKSFFGNRTLSVKRENAKYIMNQLNIKQNNDFDSRYKVMILCKALSVCDNYWITNNEGEKWADVNLTDNPLHETLQQIALFGRSLTITGDLHTPELTGQGAYAKAWYREAGSLFLYKASTRGGNESEREVSASRVLDCFNVPHVGYTLCKKEDKVVCKCRNMNVKNSSVVDAVDFDIWCSRQGKDFIDEARKIDPEMYYKTIISDYLLANSDRHGQNWGFFMNNTNGKIVGMHPLYDHNNSFDPAFMRDPDGGNCQLMPGKTQREAAMYAMRHCDFRCIKPVTRDMFVSDESYNMFMGRARELGLYREQRLSLFERLGGVRDAFCPVEVKADNRREYYDGIARGLLPDDGRATRSAPVTSMTGAAASAARSRKRDGDREMGR